MSAEEAAATRGPIDPNHPNHRNGPNGPNGEDVARIVDVAIVAGHDARAEVVIRLRYPNGGTSQLRLDQEAAQHVLDQAGILALDDLRGRRWDILRPALGAPPPGR